jgi:putative heme iron utilization protein
MTDTPDPVAASAGSAIAHLNADHADALLDIARALGGAPDATQARCTGLDRLGMELSVLTGAGSALCRVPFPEPLTSAAQLRAATVELTRRARGNSKG